MEVIPIHLKERKYSVVIDQDFKQLAYWVRLQQIQTPLIIITNSTLKKLYGHKLVHILNAQKLKGYIICIPDSEKSKSIAQMIRLHTTMLSLSASTKPWIIALGGGVVGDLAGFVASTYKRGIPFIQVPTTLLAQVDAAIGGKTGIDLPEGKNMVGTFYQPKLVYTNVATLKTLPRRHYLSGLAEVIKYAVIQDPVLFRYLEKNTKLILQKEPAALAYMIARCARIKAKIVEQDEYETKGIRIILNFGHTLAHAIETASGYSKQFTHGEAVALGMQAAVYISFRLGIAQQYVVETLFGIIKQYGLPRQMKDLSWKQLKGALQHDKKFEKGRNRFVLVKDIGNVVVKEDIPESIIRESVEKLNLGIVRR